MSSRSRSGLRVWSTDHTGDLLQEKKHLQNKTDQVLFCSLCRFIPAENGLDGFHDLTVSSMGKVFEDPPFPANLSISLIDNPLPSDTPPYSTGDASDLLSPVKKREKIITSNAFIQMKSLAMDNPVPLSPYH